MNNHGVARLPYPSLSRLLHPAFRSVCLEQGREPTRCAPARVASHRIAGPACAAAPSLGLPSTLTIVFVGRRSLGMLKLLENRVIEDNAFLSLTVAGDAHRVFNQRNTVLDTMIQTNIHADGVALAHFVELLLLI